MYFAIINQADNSPAYTELLNNTEGCGVLNQDELQLQQPALDDSDAYLEQFDEAQQRSLKLRIRIMLKHWREIFPLDEGEEVSQTTVSALRENWHVFKEGTLVIGRTSNLADVTFILADAVFDKEEQDMKAIGPYCEDFYNDPAFAMLNAGSDSEVNIKQIVDFSLTITKFLGTGMKFINPEAGMAVDLGASVLKFLFDEFYPADEKIDQNAQITACLDKMFKEHDVRLQLAAIQTYVDWIDNTKDNDAAQDDKVYLEDYKSTLKDAFNPAYRLQQGMTLIGSADYKYVGLSTYILGASVISLLYKTAILLDSIRRPVYKSGYLNQYINYLEGWINHSQKTFDSATVAIRNRMSKLSGPQGPAKGTDVTPYGPVSYDYYYYMDGDRKFEYRIHTACCVTWGGKDACQAAFDKYKKNLQEKLNQDYYYYHTGNMQKTINKLKENLNAFKKLAAERP